MRSSKRIMATCLAVLGTAVTPIVLTTGSAAATSAGAGSWPQVPGSAGHLTQGKTHYLLPRGHAATAAAASPGNNLVYGGGTGAGQVSTAPAVYVVFWGSQWSTTDPLTSYLTNFLSGLYGPGDDWTSVSQQYCQGVPSGTVTCPTGASQVGVPAGSLLKGVWFDNASPAVPLTAGVLNI